MKLFFYLNILLSVCTISYGQTYTLGIPQGCDISQSNAANVTPNCSQYQVYLAYSKTGVNEFENEDDVPFQVYPEFELDKDTVRLVIGQDDFTVNYNLPSIVEYRVNSFYLLKENIDFSNNSNFVESNLSTNNYHYSQNLTWAGYPVLDGIWGERALFKPSLAGEGKVKVSLLNSYVRPFGETRWQFYNGGENNNNKNFAWFYMIVEDFSWIPQAYIDFQKICVNDDVIDLQQYFKVDEGVLFTGTSVTDNRYFNPSIAGEGPHTITASKKYDNYFEGQTPLQNNITINVRPLPEDPTKSIGLASRDLCLDDGEVNMSRWIKDEYVLDNTSDAYLLGNGTDYVNSIPKDDSDNSDILYSYFNTTTAGVGTNNPIFVNYSSYGCRRETSIELVTNPTFEITVSGDNNLCEGDVTDLDDKFSAEPFGGQWSHEGFNINESNVFDTEGVEPMSYTLDYTVTQGKCTKTFEKLVFINELPEVEAGGNLDYCEGAGVVNLQTNGVFPTNGDWTFQISNLDDEIDNLNKTLNTDNLSNGTYSLYYNYTDENGCYNEDLREVSINDVLSFPSVEDQYLCNSGKLTFTVEFPQPGVDYYWYDQESDISPLYIGNSFTTPQTVTNTRYFYVSSKNTNGCESNRRRITAEIRETPTVDAGADIEACAGVASIALEAGDELDGTWSSPFVTGDIFNASGLPSSAYIVTYTATVDGCSANDTKSIVINDLPDVDAGSDLSFCEFSGNGDLQTVTVVPSTGTWSFNNSIYNYALSGNNNATINIDTLASGYYTLNYSATDENGCKAKDSRTVQIKSRPLPPDLTPVSRCGSGSVGINYNGDEWTSGYQAIKWYNGVNDATHFLDNISFSSGLLSEDREYYVTVTKNGCESNKAVQNVFILDVPDVDVGPDHILCTNTSSYDLTQDESPVGGEWSGTGVIDEEFYPPVAKEGLHVITYTYTAENGCSAQDAKTINVVSSLNDDIIGNDTTICASSSPIDLYNNSGVVNGTFNGPGVISNIFYPSEAGTGYKAINYTAEIDGCTYNDTKVIQIIQSPQQPTVNGDVIGCIGENVNLSIQNPSLNTTYEWYRANLDSLITTGNSASIEVGEGATPIIIDAKNQQNCGLSDYVVVYIDNENPEGTVEAENDKIQMEDYAHFYFDAVDEVAQDDYSYLWNLGDGSMSTTPDPYHYYFIMDTLDVSVTVTSDLGCERSFVYNDFVIYGDEISFPTPTSHSIEKDKVEMYAWPNPVISVLSVEFNEPVCEFDLVIRDILGNILYQNTFNNKAYINLNDEDIISQLIIIEATNDKFSSTQKIIKQ